MKLAIFSSAFHPHFGGVEELVRQLAHELIRRGHGVIVLTNQWPRTLPAEEIFEGITVYRLPFRVPAESLRSKLSYVLTHRLVQARTHAILKRHEIDVLHVQCVSCNALYALEARKRLNLPLLVTLQGELTMDAGEIFTRSSIAKELLKRSLNEAEAVSGCSKKTIDDAEGFLNKPLVHAEVIFNAARTEDFQHAAAYQHPRPYLFALGRLVPQKGFDLLIRALRESGVTSHDLLIAGDGPELSALRSLSHELEVQDRVHFLGRADRARVAELFRGCDFFVLPSRADEGLPVVCAEAMAAGKAIIAARSGGTPEAVIDGETGLVFEKEDLGKLAESLRAFCSGAALREKLGKAAEARSRLFSWEEVTRRYIATYQRLLERAAA